MKLAQNDQYSGFPPIFDLLNKIYRKKKRKIVYLTYHQKFYLHAVLSKQKFIDEISGQSESLVFFAHFTVILKKIRFQFCL